MPSDVTLSYVFDVNKIVIYTRLYIFTQWALVISSYVSVTRLTIVTFTELLLVRAHSPCSL